MFKRPLYVFVVLCLAAMGCNLPSTTAVPSPTTGGQDLIATMTALAPQQQVTETSVAPPTVAGEPTATLAPSATACTPMITVNSNANVRSGPGTVYDPPLGALTVGATAAVDGKNSEGTWWYIVFPAGPGGHGWISASLVTASCIPATLPVVAAPPTPLPASGTCKDGYVWRLIKPSDKVCVPPASKAQADADNAAADSRKAVTVYGADACKEGYVWREAYSGDHVCVTLATRSQAQADNAAAPSRWTSGAYGPHTCISGYVWREATAGDDVCVTPDVRTQTAADNAAAASRVAGPDDCISGYVWREAFSGDHVCVTPAVKTQVQADNAAAPSHTWP